MWKRLCFVLFYLLLGSHIRATDNLFNHYLIDSDSVAHYKRAAIMSLTPNFTIFAIDRFVKKSDFAFITFKSIGNNFSHLPLWDNDMFGTNLLAHPFHGSLDYSGARINGLSYWKCLPYVAAASTMWEYVLENEPASINDQVSTIAGGMMLGEISYRISNSLIKDYQSGTSRVIRESLGALFCPMNGLNRLITGKMWKVNPPKKRSQISYIPISLSIDGGIRSLHSLSSPKGCRLSPYLNIKYEYGEAFDIKDNKPLEYFSIQATLNIDKGRNLLSLIKATGALYRSEISLPGTKKDLILGFFQHYTYMDSENPQNKDIPALRLSEPASIGAGCLFRYSDSDLRISSQSYFNAVLLAAAQASRFILKGRTYNYGIGYSISQDCSLVYKKISCTGALHFLEFFTVKGYSTRTNTALMDYRKFCSMGDKGHTDVLMIHTQIGYELTQRLSLIAKWNYFFQQNHNCQFLNTAYRYSDTYIGLKYIF